MATEEDLANLQRLSDGYVPEVQGDLVGQRQSTRAIIAEYAQADPVYVHKTAALPQKYSHYRTLRGDGNCGWRALAFGYFEALIRTGDSARVQSEAVRLKSMNNLLSVLRQDADIFEDFVQETLDLLERTRVDMNEDHGRNLLASFNDDGICAAVITHFRLITSAWMKTHAGLYSPFMLNETIDQYCSTKIEPYAVEIEHLGIQALFDAVIKPAGIAMDVLYLDRSVGEEVNAISWSVDNSSGHYLSIPTIRLLYRPGHYDLLYKLEDLPDPVPQHTVPIHNMFHAPHFAATNLLYHGAFDLEACYIPGMSMTGISSSGISSTAIHPPPFSPDIYQSSPFPQHGLPMSPSSYAISPYPAPPMHSPQPHETNSQGTFRASKFELEPAYQTLANVHMEPCQTEAMKSAGESTSHFRNASFQPELWEPGPEYKNGRDTETSST